MDKDKIKKLVSSVKSKIRVTKVVATRSIKGRNGDSFVGFSAAFNTVQEDGGQGLLPVGDEQDESCSLGNMTMVEAEVAHCVLGREVDIAAYGHALASGGIQRSEYDVAVAAIKSNYNHMLMDILTKAEGENGIK